MRPSIGNRNSAHYRAVGMRTTSYIVTVYTDRPPTGSELRYPDQQIVYFGGDTFIGRYLTAPLADKDVAAVIVARVKSLTGGAPLMLNLEGVMLERSAGGHRQHICTSCMPSLAVPILQELNVKVAGLANNHSFDLGPAGFKETRAILRRAGIVAAGS